MPSPPSSTPSHHPSLFSSSNSNAFSASQRTDLQSWMTYHHLPFSALTVSEPPPQAVASSSRDLVVVSAVVGRGMLGSMRVELVVPREEVFRVQRAQIGRERRSGGSRVVLGGWEGGIEVEEKDEVDLWLEDVIGRTPPSSSSTSRQEPWFTRPVRGEHQRGGVAAAATVQFDFHPTNEHQRLNFTTDLPPSSSSSASPPSASSHTHRNHPTQDPLIFISLPRSQSLRTPLSTTSPSPRSILSVRCGHDPSSPSNRAQQHPFSSPSYLYPNPNLHSSPKPPSSSSLPPTNCANRLVLKLPLPSPITSTSPRSHTTVPPSAQQANFAFLSLPHQHPLSSGGHPGPRPGGEKKFARGWIVDASLMEGRVGFLPSSTSLEEDSGKDLDAKEWERIQCGCSSGLRRVGGEQEEQGRAKTLGCLTCGAPLGIYIPNPCVQHTLKRTSSSSNASSSSPNSASSSSAVWFIPNEFARTSPAPLELQGGRIVGR